MIFISDSIGFLFGSNWTDQAVFDKELRTQQKAVVYKTTDGGTTWHITLHADRGVFVDAVNLYDTIYALKHEYFGEQANEIKSAEVFKSVDFGDSWEKVCDVPTNSMHLCFCDSKAGFIAGNTENKVGKILYQTDNAGQQWTGGKDYKGIGNLACSKSGRVMTFLASTRNDKLSFDLLIHRELQSGTEKVESIPFDAHAFALDQEDKLWFLGRDGGGNVILYSRSELGSFEQVSTFSSDKRLTPYYVNVFENTITVIVRESDMKENENKIYPVGLKYKIYRSNDLGKTWNEEKIPVDYLIEPFAFYGQEKVWMNAGGGRLQWRN
jgi:photosystem II stability/assembly factor-like uncharacterized protein